MRLRFYLALIFAGIVALLVVAVSIAAPIKPTAWPVGYPGPDGSLYGMLPDGNSGFLFPPDSAPPPFSPLSFPDLVAWNVADLGVSFDGGVGCADTGACAFAWKSQDPNHWLLTQPSASNQPGYVPHFWNQRAALVFLNANANYLALPAATFPAACSTTSVDAGGLPCPFTSFAIVNQLLAVASTNYYALDFGAGYGTLQGTGTNNMECYDGTFHTQPSSVTPIVGPLMMIVCHFQRPDAGTGHQRFVQGGSFDNPWSPNATLLSTNGVYTIGSSQAAVTVIGYNGAILQVGAIGHDLTREEENLLVSYEQNYYAMTPSPGGNGGI